MSRFNPEFERSDAEFWEQADPDEEQAACDAPCPHCGGNTAETCNCMERFVWLDDLFRDGLEAFRKP